MFPPNCREIVFFEVTKSNGLKEVLRPSTGDAALRVIRQISLLADKAAQASRLTTGRNMSERIGQVIELVSCKCLSRHIIFQPQDFRDLHLDRHLSSHIAQHFVSSCIDFIGFASCSVIQPQDHVPVIIEFGSSNGDWLIGIGGEGSKRASRVKTDTTDVRRVDFILGERATNC